MRRRLAVPMIIIALMASGVAPAMATVGTLHPGGGTWTVGTRPDGWIWKAAVSHYYHKTKFHSATASMWGSGSVRVYKDAGQWANADKAGSKWATASTYWSTTR